MYRLTSVPSSPLCLFIIFFMPLSFIFACHLSFLLPFISTDRSVYYSLFIFSAIFPSSSSTFIPKEFCGFFANTNEEHEDFIFLQQTKKVVAAVFFGSLVSFFCCDATLKNRIIRLHFSCFFLLSSLSLFVCSYITNLTIIFQKVIPFFPRFLFSFLSFLWTMKTELMS
ncbi:hypothetical protein QOT17_017638 [Balamuthia mandrillaris]